MTWIIIAVLLLGWVVLHLPRRRSDGEQLSRIHPYRRMLSYIMVGRNEAIVFYDCPKNPCMNRFIAGQRLYQR